MVFLDLKTSTLALLDPGKVENHLGSWGCLNVQTPPQAERKRERGGGEREEREGRKQNPD